MQILKINTLLNSLENVNKIWWSLLMINNVRVFVLLVYNK
jgi:hypothetical protein